jgi:hypothetical protein
LAGGWFGKSATFVPAGRNKPVIYFMRFIGVGLFGRFPSPEMDSVAPRIQIPRERVAPNGSFLLAQTQFGMARLLGKIIKLLRYYLLC